MSCIGNILWLIFGGLATAIEYFVAGVTMCITIIGIPFGIQSFKLGLVALWPFGSQVVNESMPPSALSCIGNVIWIILGGIWISLTHLFFGLLCCITIIGIPFGMMHFKLARLALTPFGKTVL